MGIHDPSHYLLEIESVGNEIRREFIQQGSGNRGSDALKRLSRDPRRVEIEGVNLSVLGKQVPLFPWFTWGTDWPIPSRSNVPVKKTACRRRRMHCFTAMHWSTGGPWSCVECRV